MDYLESNMIYLTVMDPEGSFEYTVTAMENDSAGICLRPRYAFTGGYGGGYEGGCGHQQRRRPRSGCAQRYVLEWRSQIVDDASIQMIPRKKIGDNTLHDRSDGRTDERDGCVAANVCDREKTGSLFISGGDQLRRAGNGRTKVNPQRNRTERFPMRIFRAPAQRTRRIRQRQMECVISWLA